MEEGRVWLFEDRNYTIIFSPLNDDYRTMWYSAKYLGLKVCRHVFFA